MKYGYLTLLLIALMMPAAAITQTNMSGNYRLVLSTDPEQVIVNTPVHMHLHIQDLETGNTVGNLEVEGLIVHLQEHEAHEPHTINQNISEIHKDIPHREFLVLEANPNEPPGHYHTNYTFNETGAYEVVFQVKSTENESVSIFSLNVKSKAVIRETLEIPYSFGIIAASFIVLAALAISFRKIIDSFDIK